MRVLSLFDGMSCGMIALERAGIKVDKYYSSEIDKYAIQVSEKNYPNIIRLWDVNNWRSWDLWEIDLIIGGSPCQWFSFAGKQLAFGDPRSKLFFTMVDIINHYKPKYFLLENVKMKKEYQEVITQYMWVKPIEINSALVSAQNRKRLYWTNIPWIQQPKDKGILLKDILENEVDEKYNISETQWNKLRNYESNSRLSPLKWKCFSLTTMQWWHRQPKIMTYDYKKQVRVRLNEVNIEWLKVCLKEHKVDTIKEIAEKLWQSKTLVEHWFRQDKCFAIPDEDIWLQLKELLNITTNEFDKSIMEFEIRDWRFDTANRVYGTEWKSPTLTAGLELKILEEAIPTQLWNSKNRWMMVIQPKIAYAIWSREFEAQWWKEYKSPTLSVRDYKDPKIVAMQCGQSKNFGNARGSDKWYTIKTNTGHWMIDLENIIVRKLTPTECERLQTVPDGYTEIVSNSQRYKMLWNWRTIDVIAHIFSFLR